MERGRKERGAHIKAWVIMPSGLMLSYHCSGTYSLKLVKKPLNYSDYLFFCPAIVFFI